MFKRILACLLTLSIILSMSTAVFAVDTEITCSSISFTDLSGNPVTEISLAPIIAKTTIVANPTDQKPVLLVCRYDGGMLKEIWHKTADALTGDISLQFTPTTAAGEIKATLLNDLKTLNYSSASAKLAEDNTNLSLVMVNGEVFEEYSDGTDVYKVMVEEGSTNIVNAIPADGGTTVEIENASTLPGSAKIKITSASGIERIVQITFYTDISQLSKLMNLTYTLDGQSYDIPGFDAATTEYTVNLPDNTFFIKVNPETLAVTNTKVNVSEVNFKTKTFDTVYDGNNYSQMYAIKNNVGDFSYGFDGLFKTAGRPSVNNVIPIKNEETKAVITTSYGGTSLTYTVTFKSTQPRLIDFGVSQAVKDAGDKFYPVFVGGAAAYNDNGTLPGQDRTWALGNISKNLIGASMFSTYMNSNLASRDSKDNNKWIDNNSNGEYFHFTANTAGTVYLLAADTITNFDDYGNIPEGESIWTKSTYEPDYVPQGYANWNVVPRTYNDFPEGEFFARKIEFPETDRVAEGALTKDISSYSPQNFAHAYARTFNAGEPVSIYHTGRSGNGAFLVFIKWNIPEVNTASLYSEEEFYGEENAEYNQISLFSENVAELYSENPDVVTVGGTADPYSKVSFMLLDSSSMGCVSEDDTFNAYKSMVDQNDELTTSQIFFYENIIAGADGKWSYTIPMTDIESKELTLITNTGEVKYIQYGSKTFRAAILPTLVNGAQVTDDGNTLKDAITTYIGYISDRAKLYKNLNDDNKLKVAQFNKDMIASLDPSNSSELGRLKTGIDSAIVIFGVKEGDITDFEDAMSIVSYDTTENSNITSAGQEKLVTLLKNDRYTSIADYQNKAKVHFALQLFNYNTENSADNLLEVLENNNSILNLDLSGLYSLNKINQPRAAKSLALTFSDSVSAAQANLNEIVEAIAKEEENDDELSDFGGGGGGGFGSSSTIGEHKVHNSSASQSISNEYLQENKYIYSDMKDASWAADAVLYLSNEGIISGYEDSTFKPLNPITRAEFTKLIVSAFFSNKKFEFSGNFKDINGNEWYAEYVNIAYNMGVVSGDEKGCFNPNDTISREDMAVIIYNAGMKFNLFEGIGESYQFNDDSNISDYAKTAVYTLKSKSVVNGTGNGFFSPKKSADRASAAKILYELIMNNVE